MRVGVQLIWLCAAVALPSAAAAQDPADSIFVDVRQGTDMSVATVPDLEFAVIELLGRLWRLPVTGGAALPLTPAEVTVRHPRLDAGGTRVVYQQFTAAGWDIRLLNLDTGVSQAVTNDAGNEREPDFLGDDRIVFAADRSGQYDLWSVSLDGGQWQPVSTEPGAAHFPDVADNGAIVYVVNTGSQYALRIRADGITRTLHETNRPLSAPTWRPGGGVIVFQERRSATDARLRMAVLSPELLIRDLSEAEDVFASRVAWLDANAFLYAADGQIWRRRLAARVRRPVHLFATAVVTPATTQSARTISPALGEAALDGDAAPRAGAVVAVAGNLWLHRDGESSQLTRGGAWDADPLTAPDGRSVIFSRDADNSLRLWQLRLDDGTLTALTPPGERAFSAALDDSGTRLAWLSAEAGFTERSSARLNTLYLDDDTRQRSSATVHAVGPPVWLEDNRTAAIALTGTGAHGEQVQLAFDAGLRSIPPQDVDLNDTQTTVPALDAAASLATAVPDAATSDPVAPGHYVIQAGRLFDGIGTQYRRHVDIHIEDGRITNVVARGRLPLPADVVDATQRTVLPGFIDAHAHDVSLIGELAGRAWLAWGVTTVRSVDADALLRRGLAPAWNAGSAAGPRIIAATHARARSNLVGQISAPRLYDDPFVVLADEASDFDLAGALLPPLPATIVQPLPRRYSAAHQHYQDVYALQSAAGTAEISSIAVFSPAATARLLAARPTLQRRFEQFFAAADRRAWLETAALSNAREARLLALTRFLRAGTRIAVGTETPHTPPGLGLHVEFAGLAEAGLPNDQILRAATSTAAFALGLEQEIGTVEAGRRADLLIVAGDPLSDIADAAVIQTVIRDGRRIAAATLHEPVAVSID